MGHLPIVNDETFQNVLNTGFISTRGDLGTNWLKTVADLFSDVLAARQRDIIFPWFTQESKKIGFKYKLKVAGPPIFVPKEEYPIKLPVKAKGYKFSGFLSEADALNLWRRKLLWNAIGKKSLGRGRSLLHQTSWEDGELENMMNSVSNRIDIINISRVNYQNSIQISIHSGLCKQSQATRPEDIKFLDPTLIKWNDGEKFINEKAFEAWIMEKIDKTEGASFRQVILGIDSPNQLKEFYNYLPYGVQGSNMDILVVTQDENILTFHVIELKKDRLSYNGYLEAARQVHRYERFIREFSYAYQLINVQFKSCVISAEPSENARNQYIGNGNFHNVDWFYYKIQCNDGQANVIFQRVNINT